ncbi:MAG TPA: GNAT family N-acetyltransferase [Actinomycetota bacterium]|nr:GNAT family N-acetyltransferase [Actinomycetota bacterium]
MEFEGELPDGRRILFRKIRPDDKKMLADGFDRLSPESRYRRFFRHIDRLSEKDLRYLTEIDFRDHYAWVAVLPDEPSMPGVGVARWIRIPQERDRAEAAVTVIDSMQNQGIGTSLLWLLGRSAIDNGIRAFRVWVQGENHPMLGLLREQGIEPTGWTGGVAEMDIPLPGAGRLLEERASRFLKVVATGEAEGEASESRVGTRLIEPSERGEGT